MADVGEGRRLRRGAAVKRRRLAASWAGLSASLGRWGCGWACRPRAEGPSPWQRGEVVCTQCGLVVDGVVDTGPEWRIYVASQLVRIRAAPLRLVGRTEMGVKVEHDPRRLSPASAGIPYTAGGEEWAQLFSL